MGFCYFFLSIPENGFYSFTLHFFIRRYMKHLNRKNAAHLKKYRNEVHLKKLFDIFQMRLISIFCDNSNFQLQI